MFVVVDIETEGLIDPQKIWVCVLKEIDTNKTHVFRNLHENPRDFTEFSKGVTAWVGHNVISFDLPVLRKITGLSVDPKTVVDTIVVSRLLNYGIEGGHGLEAWGQRLGCKKSNFKDFSRWSQELEDYCIQDTAVTLKLFQKFKPYVYSPDWRDALRLEHDIAWICRDMQDNGFAFDIEKAKNLYREIDQRVVALDEELVGAFAPRIVELRTVTPRATKHGTISRVDFRWLDVPDLSPYSIGSSFTLIEFEPFNPGSPKQIVERLNSAGWKPFEKTKGHLEAERELRWCKDKDRRKVLEDKLKDYQVYGWKVSENNLSTLPTVEHLEDWYNHCRIKIPQHVLNSIKDIISTTQNANEPLHENITIETKSIIETNSYDVITGLVSKTIAECFPNSTDAAKFVETTSHLWLITVTPQDAYVDCSVPCATGIWAGSNVTENLRLAISSRKAAQKLVERLLLASRRSTLQTWITAFREPSGRIHGNFNHIGAWTQRMSHSDPNMANVPSGETPYAHEMRSLWTVPKGRLLVGVDADGIQLRILAHYMNDPVFTEALVRGDKEAGTDAHTLNQNALGRNICRTRDDAKTFIYAWLLGAGIGKIAQILGCSYEEAKVACENFLESYPGLYTLKNKVIPKDAQKGYFKGLDKRLVLCDNEHLMLAGYLQCGESIVMKKANVLWRHKLDKERIPYWQVNYVHDEWQTETIDDFELAKYIAEVQADAIREVGEELKLNCPLAGSIINSSKQLSIGLTWNETH